MLKTANNAAIRNHSRLAVAPATFGRDDVLLSAGQTTEGGLTRRGLIGAGAASGAGIVAARLPDAAEAAPRKVDAIVIGAGLAGLAAADALRKEGKSFVVLEARARVGGRTQNRSIGKGDVVEIGGQWVGPTQDRVLDLIDDLGLKTFPTFIDGENLYYRSANPGPIKLQRYTGTIPPANPAALAEVLLVITKLDSMAAEVPREAPWEAANATEWDSQTFETWKQDNTTTDEARDLVDLAVEAIFAAEPRDLSLLHVLFYIAAAGGFNRLIDTAGGAQERRIVGGSQLIAIRLAKRLRPNVILSSPVRSIKHGNGSVTVRAGGKTYQGKRAIISIPPTLAGRIRYAPALPAGRDQLTQRVPMGSVIKCMAVYDEPFWRTEGLSGMATSDTGPVKLTYDNSPPSDNPRGVLLGFIEGQEAREMTSLSKAERKDAVLSSFERYFGPEARSGAKKYLDKSWAEEVWTRGCYVGYTPPGVIVGYREALREPVGRLHWAGTETATIWNGYLDGAIESGRRAAAEVLSEL
ncbi:MAG: flavin monoamine oxidase family protein [Solirubrobacterales bacterium]